MLRGRRGAAGESAKNASAKGLAEGEAPRVDSLADRGRNPGGTDSDLSQPGLRQVAGRAGYPARTRRRVRRHRVFATTSGARGPGAVSGPAPGLTLGARAQRRELPGAGAPRRGLHHARGRDRAAPAAPEAHATPHRDSRRAGGDRATCREGGGASLGGRGGPTPRDLRHAGGAGAAQEERQAQVGSRGGGVPRWAMLRADAESRGGER